MKPVRLIVILSFVFFLIEGCNTLYQTKIIDIEIVEPGEVKIPGNYKKIAVRFNNCNVSPNPLFYKSFQDDKVFIDTTNLDSVASRIYYQIFVEELQKHLYFDSIIKVEDYDYSLIKIEDTLSFDLPNFSDSIFIDENKQKYNVYAFSNHLKKYPVEKEVFTSTKYLHPNLCLYQEHELQKIADTTNAQLLISFDYYSSTDGMYTDEQLNLHRKFVLSQAYWNFYDLQTQEYLFFFNRKDTVIWEQHSGGFGPSKNLPGQKDAVLNAADMAGTEFAQYLVPHWINVQRMYYTSGHVELKKTIPLVEKNKWLEAAEIWKANINNSNKSIVAKCKFNMALACEMQGNLDAALEWVVDSYHVFGQDNIVHSANCMEYIRILGKRKLDKKLLDKQFESVN